MVDTGIFNPLEEEDLLLIATVLHQKNAHKPEQNGCTKSWKNERDEEYHRLA